ncbi:MAG: shikimate kinase [Acidobacteriaceae bacterium]
MQRPQRVKAPDCIETDLSGRIERIILTGFMGAGKSTVGRTLAEALRWQFLDTDDLVREAHHASPAEIFARHGEPFFRQAELVALTGALQQSACVVGLGGGLLETESALPQILETPATLLVFLEAPPPTLFARCCVPAAGMARPLLGQLSEFAERYAQRLPRYRNAHLTVATNRLTPHDVARRIQKEIEHRILDAAAKDASRRTNGPDAQG